MENVGQARSAAPLPDPGRRVLYAEALYGAEEIAAVVEVLEHQNLALMTGPSVAAFEARVAELFGKSRGIMVNSGSSANLLALASLGLPAGSEVVTPALTFGTTVSPIVQLGLRPAFVDVEEDTFNIDASGIEELIGPATKVLMVPNLIGNLPDWPAISKIAGAHDLTVIEDSADTIGARINGEPSGKASHLATTSFYASHVVTGAGFGGMVCVDDAALLERLFLLRGWGRNSSVLSESERIEDRFGVELDGISYDAKFVFSALGYNFLPSEISAAFGLVQLGRLDQYLARRVDNFRWLHDFFGQWPDWFVLPRQRPEVETGWLAFPLLLKTETPFTRTELQIAFEKRGVQTRVVFTGNVLRQPAFRDVDRRESGRGYPNADAVMARGMLIGCHQGMTTEDLEYIGEVFQDLASGW
ncbi:MAG: aminotransferase class I/II-fold pyridoxal phosphate-dependent enzyme [Acidimicrobiia bacterium]